MLKFKGNLNGPKGGDRMKTAIQGNFEFVKEIFPELYEPLHNAESLALLNHRGSGLLLRNVNELYCTLLLEEYGMSSEIGRAHV